MSASSLIIMITLALASQSSAAPSPKVSGKVALVFDLTGKRKPALEVIKGIELAADQLRKEGVDLEIIKYNSQSDASGTRAAMLEVLKNPPDIIIAELDSSKAFVAAEMADQAKRVMITPNATSPMVTKDRKYAFRACFSDDFQGARLAEFAKKELKTKRAAILVDATQLYSKTLGEVFKKTFPGENAEVVYEENILPDQTSFKDQLKKIDEAKADVIFLPTYDETASRFINESIQLGLTKTIFLGGDGWGATPTFGQLVATKDPVRAFWVSQYSRDFNNPAIATVSKAFEAKFSKNFNDTAAAGYDTTMLVGRVLKSAGKNKSQENLVRMFHKMKPYLGLTGTTHFGNSQDPKKSLFVLGLKNGQTTFVRELKP